MRLQANKSCGSWFLQTPPEASSCHSLDTKHIARKAVKEESDLLHTWLDSLATSGTDGKFPFLNWVSKLSELVVEKEASTESLGNIQKAEQHCLPKEKGDKYFQG